MTLLVLFILLAAFFGWLFIYFAVAKVAWFTTIPLIIAGMFASGLFLIAIGNLWFFVEKAAHRHLNRSC